VETVFSMIKARLGERLRSKSETAQINEALKHFSGKSKTDQVFGQTSLFGQS